MGLLSAALPIIKENEYELISAWENEQKATIRPDLLRGAELRVQCKEFFRLFLTALTKSPGKDTDGAEWSEAKDFLSSISHTRGIQGFSPSETAQFVFSFKRPLTALIRQKGGSLVNMDELIDVGDLLDKLGLFTTETYQKAREEVISRQQQDMLELSTPVVELSKGIIALPMIGTLDSHRTQIVMETLLQRIVETEADIAIIDITGVPTVDTLVAQHLLKTVTAAKLMGAECIISGIRPQIAATIVHLGVDLGNVVTKATLASAFSLALKKTGFSLVKTVKKEN
ncbi:MAG TPA: STAS domain-containing protein [Bacteriovoracaceae bacterium]|nr:STAS domain-containing protein [Bacteriovoracaceae bacterium]